MNIYITRHSKTVWNQEKRLQGRKDSPLIKEGIENAVALKEYIKDISFDCVFSSPIERAYYTAKLLTDNEIIKDDRLMEMNFGILEGKKIEDILKEDYEVYNNMWNHPELFERILEGESYDEVQNRLHSFFEDLKTKDYQNVLIVTHGMCFINMLAYMMKLDRKDTINFTLRMPVEQRIELERIAKKEDRTATNLINMALKRYIEMYNGEKK